MSIESDIFQTHIPDFKKLKLSGFKKQNQYYVLSVLFKNNEFRADISINNSGKVSGKVFDIENNEEYFPLRIENNEGSFAAKTKEEYIKILVDIRNKYFIKQFFVSPQGNRISEMIKNKYGDRPVFMWEKYPTFGVFKNPKTDKWYGLIMYIEYSKLEEGHKGKIEVINLKLDDNKIPDLTKKAGIYPAYHMNKKYWVTIVLNNTYSDAKIMEFIDESYKYTISKKLK